MMFLQSKFTMPRSGKSWLAIISGSNVRGNVFDGLNCGTVNQIFNGNENPYRGQDNFALQRSLEYEQSKVATVGVVLAQSDIGRLELLEEECYRTRADLSARASLLLAYGLLKAGLTYWPRLHPVCVRLENVARGRLPERMAAKWLLGRIYLALTTLLTDKSSRINLTLRATECFTSIDAIKLDYPVLLPGLNQEYPPKLLGGDSRSPFSDPLVCFVRRPHRYHASAAISLAELGGGDFKLGLQQARFCSRFIASEKEDAPIPFLNAFMAENSALVLLARGGASDVEGVDLKEIVGRVQSALMSIDRLKDSLGAAKTHEWRAVSYANLALLDSSKEGGRDGISEMQKEIVSVIKTRSGPSATPDFFSVDPGYRVAMDRHLGPGSFNDFLLRVGMLPELS